METLILLSRKREITDILDAVIYSVQDPLLLRAFLLKNIRYIVVTLLSISRTAKLRMFMQFYAFTNETEEMDIVRI